jgi:hypothetical protein
MTDKKADVTSQVHCTCRNDGDGRQWPRHVPRWLRVYRYLPREAAQRRHTSHVDWQTHFRYGQASTRTQQSAQLSALKVKMQS